MSSSHKVGAVDLGAARFAKARVILAAVYRRCHVAADNAGRHVTLTRGSQGPIVAINDTLDCEQRGVEGEEVHTERELQGLSNNIKWMDGRDGWMG